MGNFLVRASTGILKKFKNQNILITGHTGFKGSYLSTFLNYLGSI